MERTATKLSAITLTAFSILSGCIKNESIQSPVFIRIAEVVNEQAARKTESTEPDLKIFRKAEKELLKHGVAIDSATDTFIAVETILQIERFMNAAKDWKSTNQYLIELGDLASDRNTFAINAFYLEKHSRYSEAKEMYSIVFTLDRALGFENAIESDKWHMNWDEAHFLIQRLSLESMPPIP